MDPSHLARLSKNASPHAPPLQCSYVRVLSSVCAADFALALLSVAGFDASLVFAASGAEVLPVAVLAGASLVPTELDACLMLLLLLNDDGAVLEGCAALKLEVALLLCATPAGFVGAELLDDRALAPVLLLLLLLRDGGRFLVLPGMMRVAPLVLVLLGLAVVLPRLCECAANAL